MALPDFNPDDIDASLRRFREMLPKLIANELLQAQLTRAKFNALVKEGFTEEQAIQLCRPRP